MTILLVFLAGALFIDILLPLLESSGNCLGAWIEQKKTKYIKEIAIINKEIENLHEHEEEKCFPTGFQIPIKEEGEEEENEIQ